MIGALQSACKILDVLFLFSGFGARFGSPVHSWRHGCQPIIQLCPIKVSNFKLPILCLDISTHLAKMLSLKSVKNMPSKNSNFSIKIQDGTVLSKSSCQHLPMLLNIIMLCTILCFFHCQSLKNRRLKSRSQFEILKTLQKCLQHLMAFHFLKNLSD